VQPGWPQSHAISVSSAPASLQNCVQYFSPSGGTQNQLSPALTLPILGNGTFLTKSPGRLTSPLFSPQDVAVAQELVVLSPMALDAFAIQSPHLHTSAEQHRGDHQSCQWYGHAHLYLRSDRSSRTSLLPRGVGFTGLCPESIFPPDIPHIRIKHQSHVHP
jgi:hypothetical protein